MKRFVAVLVLSLAACRPEAPVSPAAEAPAPVASPAAQTAPAAVKELFNVTAGQKTLPAPFIGTWDAKAEWCGEKQSDARLKIVETTMTFWESEGVVASITPVGPNIVDVDAKFTGEGETWDGRLRMELSADANELTITNGDTPFTRERCP